MTDMPFCGRPRKPSPLNSNFLDHTIIVRSWSILMFVIQTLEEREHKDFWYANPFMPAHYMMNTLDDESDRVNLMQTTSI